MYGLTAASSDSQFRSKRRGVLAWCGSVAAWSALALLVALVLAVPLAAQRGARVLHRNIGQLVETADVIFRGEVISAYNEPHPTRRINTVVVTFKVLEVLKGQPGAQFTFRQYLWDQQDVKTKLDYSPGQQYLMLMRNPNPDGLSSPSGMEQGRFRLLLDDAGLATATNGFDNVGLLRGVDQSTPGLKVNLSPATSARMAVHKRGPISYDDLKNLIQSAMATGN